MTTPGMLNGSSRLRALAVLIVTFSVGGLSGVTIDRAWFRPVAEPRPEARAERTEPRRAERRTPEPIDADQIPLPLERLQPTPEEERRLHEIARRWRPQAALAIENIRASISDLENNMFAEMLCVLSKDKQDRYLAQLEEGGDNRVLIDKRFALVRSNQCGQVRR